MQVTWSEACIEAVEDIVTRLIGILHEDILQGHLDEADVADPREPAVPC